jgi:hypothetical protein
MKSKKPNLAMAAAPAHPKPKQPISKQPKFIMPTFKTASVKMPSFVVLRLALDMRTKRAPGRGRRQAQLLLGYCKESRWHIKLFGSLKKKNFVEYYVLVYFHR